jgi:hypothetical protein
VLISSLILAVKSFAACLFDGLDRHADVISCTQLAVAILF